MADESWSELIEAQQVCQTVYGQVPGSCITDEDCASRTARPGLRVPIPWM